MDHLGLCCASIRIDSCIIHHTYIEEKTMMKIIVINCGSSSIKYQIYDIAQKVVVAKGLVACIGAAGSYFKRNLNGKEQLQVVPILSHKEGFELIFRTLTDPDDGVLNDLSEIVAVGHRVAHGGAQFTKSTLIDDEIVNQIEEFIPLAPLHNPMNLLGIYLTQQLLPHAKQVAVFDTCFHHTLPLKVRVFPIPYEYFENYGIQRCGFHSQSYRFIIPRAAKLVGRPVDELKMIICHLGNGCTVTAIDGGKSVDTSLGFSTFAGVMMGTRPGNFDPGLIFYLNRELGMSLDEIEEMLYKDSGLLGISGVSSDMRVVEREAEHGNQRCQLALDMFTDRVKKAIGAFTATLGGLDVLVFSAGIGENSPVIRDGICAGLGCFGIELDRELNLAAVGEETIISSKNSVSKVLVVPTNEEQIIIEDTLKLAGLEDLDRFQTHQRSPSAGS